MPVLILVVIAVPSIRLLAHQYSPPAADLTVKVIGNQWYWNYEYPDHGVNFDSNMLPDDQARARGEPRQLAADKRMVVPVGAVVKVIVTSTDVIHAWGVPAFWIKMDAVPGRLNETWFRAERAGRLLRRLLRIVRRPPRLHADRGRGGEPRAVRPWVASQGGTHARRPARAPRRRRRRSPRPRHAATPAPSNVVARGRAPADHEPKRAPDKAARP